MKNSATYLGDGVYVQLAEEHILLTTGNHAREKADNEIFLEEEVFVKFMDWCKRVAIPGAIPPPDAKAVAEENATLAVERATELKAANEIIKKLRTALQAAYNDASNSSVPDVDAMWEVLEETAL